MYKITEGFESTLLRNFFYTEHCVERLLCKHSCCYIVISFYPTVGVIKVTVLCLVFVRR